MVIIQSYFVAVLMCVITMLCWGSWANTQKMASKKWAFQLFYWDYSLGVLILALILAFTMGSSGEEGRGFLADLAAARGVIASAGFSLISECMYLKKKMLLLPLAGQYEQIINARYIQELGLGISADKLDEATLARFLDELDKPTPRDKRIIWPDNDRFFDILQKELNKLDTPVSIELSQ